MTQERKNEILNLMIDWLDYHDLPDLVDELMDERYELDVALSDGISFIDDHIHDKEDKELAWKEVIGLTDDEMNELHISDIYDYLDESKGIMTENTEIYENEEEAEDTLTITDGKLTDTSVGDIINFGEVAGFVKVQNTTYLMIKDGNSLYAYSVDTGFPYKFNKK